jgi:polysaccharide biosynthesis protein PslH
MSEVLLVTPMLPHPQAVNAGALVMHHQLVALAARCKVTLACFAGPEPREYETIQRLRDSGISVHWIWRPEPSLIVRLISRSSAVARFANVPDASEWAGQTSIHTFPGALSLYQSSPLASMKWRLQQSACWIRGRYPIRTTRFWHPHMQALLNQVLSDNSFDMIHVEDNAMASYRYATTAPKVLTEYEVRHEPVSDIAPQRTSGVRAVLTAAERRRWERYQPAAWSAFDSIQVFTVRDASAIRSLAPDLAARVWVNPFGIDLPPQAAAPRREQHRMLVFVGGFGHAPNIDAAVWLGREIMPLLRARQEGVQLTIVGSNPPPDVRRLASADILVTGRVPSVEPYLERASVVLAPVRTGGGMRMKVLQAMAFGKPVVTTPLGAEGLAEVDGGPPVAIGNDAAGIANATVTLLADEGQRRRLGQRARAFVGEHHTWRAYAARLEGMHSQLLTQHADSRHLAGARRVR